MRITSLVLRRKFSTLAILAGLMVLGTTAFFSMPVNFLPDMTYPLIRVGIQWPGATPEEIDRSIADPVERQMASVDGVDYIESSITEGNYRLVLSFRYGVDVNVAFQDAAAAMGRVNRLLPDDIEPPVITKADPSQLPILQVALTSSSWNLTRLRTWVQDRLEKELLAVPGVAGVETVGGQKREIRVFLRPDALIHHRLTPADVESRIAAENVEMFAGRLIEGRRHWVVRTLAEARTVEDFRNLVLQDGPAGKILLSDVADVVDGAEDVRTITRLDGHPALKLNVTKQPLANTVEVSDAVAARLRELAPLFPADVRAVVLENQSIYVKDAIAGVRSSALGAALLVIGTVLLFLGGLRPVLVLLIAIPVILVINFILMKIGNFSLNIFSLGGLVIALGVLLDNSTVVMENITRVLGMGNPRMDTESTLSMATGEVGSSLVAGTLSFLALFLPFLFIPGLVSLMFRELILVISGIVLISLGVALTLTPLLADALVARPHAGKAAGHSRLAWFSRIAAAYGGMVAAAVRKRRLLLAAMLALIAGAAWTWTRLDGEFLPAVDDGRVAIRLRLLPGTSVAETERLAAQVEKLLAKEPRVASYFTVAGGMSRGPLLFESPHEGEISVQLKSGGGRMETLAWIAGFRKKVAAIRWPGATLMVAQQRIRGIRRMGDYELEIKLRGDDMKELQHAAQQVFARLQNHPSFANVQLSADFRKPELQVHLDRARCALLGLSAHEVARALRTYLGGTVVSSFREAGQDFDVRVSVPETALRRAEDLRNLPVARRGGGQVLLSDIARVEPGLGPVEISREDQIKQVTLLADTRGVSLSRAQRLVHELIEEMGLPAGISTVVGGQAQVMRDMQKDMLVILLFSLLLAFIVLAVQFDDFKLPLLLLAGLFPCLAGVVFGLEITGFAVGATVLIGMLVVVSAAINDGVLLYTFAEELRSHGQTPSASVIQAAVIRLRPRVMTTLTTFVGFLPLALNLGGGNEMLQPMAAGAMGGLVAEFFVALFLMPALYCFMYRE